MASRIFDFPDPFRPVIALNSGSQPSMTVRTAYDLNPSIIRDLTCMVVFSGGRGEKEGASVRVAARKTLA